MAQAGILLEIIQDTGRGSTKAFKSYICDHPVLRLRAWLDHPLARYWHAGAFVNFSYSKIPQLPPVRGTDVEHVLGTVWEECGT